MAHKSTLNRGPKSPLEFYIELYCKRRKLSELDDNDNNIVLQATKSWTTLGEEEKTQFVNKYNECKRKQRYKLAYQLKQIELYMKRKQHCKRISGANQNEDLPNKSNENCIIGIDNSFSQSEMIKSPIHEIAEETTPDEGYGYNVPLVSNTTEQVRNEVVIAPSEAVLTEPVPPSIKTSKELFEMIQAKNGANDVSWSTLSNIEKSRYRRAVYLLKKNYLSNFRKYLESLSSKELFNFYVQKLDS
ncbi:uncharacterized protein ACR2FA_011473 [Aphomia sociella]